MARNKFKKGKFIKAVVTECFECGAVTTFYKKGDSITLEEGERMLEEQGWVNTPRGFYCAACRNRDAEQMLAVINELNQPHIVDAVKDTDRKDTMTDPGGEATPNFTVIETTPEGYRMMKRQFQRSVETYQEQLRSLDLLLTTIQSIQFGEAAGDIHTLLEEMVESKRATIEEAIEGLTSGITELEHGGY